MIDTIMITKRISNECKYWVVERANKESIVIKNGEVIKCKIGCMNIIFTNDKIKVTVALPTLKYGHNLYSLKYADVKVMICRIEELLGFEIGDAYLSRVDLAQNIIVENDSRLYFQALLYKQKYNRQDFRSGFSLSRSSKYLSFYDKHVQFKKFFEKKGIAVIPEFENEKVIRYEFSIRTRLNQTMKRGCVTVNDLLDKNLYNELIGMWISEYLGIVKTKDEIIDKGMFTKSDYKNYLAFVGAIAKGGEKILKQEVEVLKKAKSFNNPTQPLRRLELIDELFRNGYLCRENSLMKELNKKVMEAAFMNYV